MHTTAMITATLLLALGISEAALAQGPLAKARESYAAAEYEACLEALEAAEVPEAQTAQAGEYRALCLLALNREGEATAAVESVVRAVPTYSPPANSSPRLKKLVETVRASILPSVVQAEYAAAKRAYDARDLEAAERGFSLVLTLLSDPEGGSVRAVLPADYATLASGFVDLINGSRAASAPPAAAEVPVFTAGDRDVLPPVPQRQVMPRWNRPSASLSGARFRGRLEVLIDVDGHVESATLLERVHPSYDEVLLRAAREWTYDPARRNGEPVRYRKILAVNLEDR